MTGWELLRAARDGDRDAFADFYRQYRPIVASYLHGRGVPSNDVDDLTSEVFLRAWRHLDTVTEQRDDPGAWLFTIARNLALDLAKSAHHRLSRPIAEIPEPRRPGTGAGRVAPSAEDVALEAIERAETAAQVRSTLARLNPMHRQAVAAFLADRSHNEEAARTGINCNASKARRIRALRAARAALTQEHTRHPDTAILGGAA